MKQGNAVLISVIAVFAIVASAGIAYFVSQNVAKNQISSSPTTTPTVSPTQNANDLPLVIPTEEPKENSTVVVFESEASLPTSDKSQIQERVVNPVIDYYKMEAKDSAVSIKVKINTQVSKAEFPYLFEYILESGANGGGIISKTNGQINWWYPECLNSCNLSNEFATKYPEIKDLVN